MYVYDQSFSLYKEDLCKLKTEEPIIYCYIPKLYRLTCYKIFNHIADKYDKTKKKINLDEEGNKRTKKEIEKENIILKEQIRQLKQAKDNEPNKKFNYVTLFLLISAIIFIISERLVK